MSEGISTVLGVTPTFPVRVHIRAPGRVEQPRSLGPSNRKVASAYPVYPDDRRAIRAESGPWSARSGCRRSCRACWPSASRAATPRFFTRCARARWGRSSTCAPATAGTQVASTTTEQYACGHVRAPRPCRLAAARCSAPAPCPGHVRVSELVAFLLPLTVRSTTMLSLSVYSARPPANGDQLHHRSRTGQRIWSRLAHLAGDEHFPAVDLLDRDGDVRLGDQPRGRLLDFVLQQLRASDPAARMSPTSGSVIMPSGRTVTSPLIS